MAGRDSGISGNGVKASDLLDDGVRVRLASGNCGDYLRCGADGALDAKGNHTNDTYFKVHKGPGHHIRLRRGLEESKYLRVDPKGEQLHSDGGGGGQTEFELHDHGHGVVSFKAVKGDGHIGWTDAKAVKPPKNTGQGSQGRWNLEVAVTPAKLGLAEGARVRFKSVASGKFMRVKDDKSIDASGGNGAQPWLRVTAGPGNYVRFQSEKFPDGHHYICTAANGTAMGDGGGGSLTEYEPVYHVTTGLVSLNVVSQATGFLGFDKDGVSHAASGVGSGPWGQFILHSAFAPEMFGIHDGSVVRFKSCSSKNYLRPMPDGSADGDGGAGDWPWVKAHVVNKGVKFEAMAKPGAYMKVAANGHVSGDGGGGKMTILELVNLGHGKVALRSHAHQDAHIGVDHQGKLIDGKKVDPGSPEGAFEIEFK